jgi:hypothetical protein
MNYGKGWYFESWRHSLAAKGIRTSLHSKLNGSLVGKTRHGIPITVKAPSKTLKKGRAYPIAPDEVKQRFDKFKKKEVEGITEINFRDPGIPATKQDKAWAQYARGDRRVNVFSQPFKKGKFKEVELELEDPWKAKEHMAGYVLPHETGHHYYQYNLKMDKDDVLTEEARADAFAAGEDPKKPWVLAKYRQNRKQMFGRKGSI